MWHLVSPGRENTEVQAFPEMDKPFMKAFQVVPGVGFDNFSGFFFDYLVLVSCVGMKWKTTGLFVSGSTNVSGKNRSAAAGCPDGLRKWYLCHHKRRKSSWST